MADPELESTNEVLLRGQIRHPPTQRALPSGDELVTFRLLLPRTRTTREKRRVTDWVDCTVWDGRIRTRAAGWREGDQVEVRGALRRRFFRAGAETGTRLEVEVNGGRILRRAG